MQLNAGLPQRFADQMGALLGPDFPSDIGIAVSGGGDSMAMLHLAAGWAREFGVRLWCLTVDHGLRAESVAEAALVAQDCAILDVPHTVLKWEGWDGKGNVQDAARQARFDLINRWRGGVGHVLLGHTQDDQAETFLMRLTRGSGVDGLAGMRPTQTVRTGGAVVELLEVEDSPPQSAERESDWIAVRPMLEIARAELRHYADTLKIPYVDDPSNDDTRFARVRLRKFLEQEGLDMSRLVITQKNMARAKEALGQRACNAARACLRETNILGILAIDRDAFAQIESESQLRILAGALQSVTSATYRPRLSALSDALERTLAGGKTTLHGAMIVPKADAVFLGREFNAVKDHEILAGLDQLWDNRFSVYGADIKGFTVRALGPNGATQARGQLETDIPWSLMQAQPSVWQGDSLVAYQPAGYGPAYVCEDRGVGKDFPYNLLTH